MLGAALAGGICYTGPMSDHRYPCAAALSFGLEAVVRAELEAMGISGSQAEDRRVTFEATAAEIARANLRLRTADRVLIRLGEFRALDFGELYEGIRSIPWRDIVSHGAAITVHARSNRSRLISVPALQSVGKKAVVDALLHRAEGHHHGSGGGHHRSGPMHLEETGPHHDVEIAIQGDTVAVLLDTSGAGLHRRGYRTEAGEAPLRETLAAALVLLSRWEPPRPFADPLCGSGTIPIEAAMVAAQIAPGRTRSFAGEALSILPSAAWSQEREAARSQERRGISVDIAASDKDPRMVDISAQNARRAGVSQLVRVRRASMEGFQSSAEYGCMVCNPPYGERVGERNEVSALEQAMGRVLADLPTWSLFALTADTDFPRNFGSRPSRNRKLYNGNIRCYYYQYFGPLPPHPSGSGFQPGRERS